MSRSIPTLITLERGHLQGNDSDHNPDYHVLEHTNPASADKHLPLWPWRDATAREQVRNCGTGFQLGHKVVLGGEKVAEVAEEVVEDVSFVAFA